MKLFTVAFAAALAVTACSAASTGRSPTGMVAQARALQAGQNEYQIEAQRRSAIMMRADSPKGVIQTVGQIVQLIEKGLGITGLEDEINKVLGGHLVSWPHLHVNLAAQLTYELLQYGLLNEAGITKAELGLGLTDDGCVPDGILEKLLHLVKILDDKLGMSISSVPHHCLSPY